MSSRAHLVLRLLALAVIVTLALWPREPRPSREPALEVAAAGPASPNN